MMNFKTTPLMKKKIPGETWETTKKGVTYLMEAQQVGKAKRIQRITPYKDKSKANGLSNIPATKGLPKKGTRPMPKTLNGKFPINTNKDIKTTPFNPLTHRMVKTNPRTWKEVKI